MQQETTINPLLNTKVFYARCVMLKNDNSINLMFTHFKMKCVQLNKQRDPQTFVAKPHVIMKNHVFTFDKEIRKQTKGGN